MDRDWLLKQLKKIKLLALDFDGTLTVGGFVLVNQKGEEMVICCRKDTLNFKTLQKIGVRILVISTETNPVVEMRCKKMKVDYYYGAETGEQKLDILKKYMREHQINQEETAYVGDDVNDLECLKFVGTAFAVADCHFELKPVARYITTKKGGKGAVREICDLIIEAKKIGGENAGS